jgi:23S rRNA pseudouridine2605 synthase
LKQRKRHQAAAPVVPARQTVLKTLDRLLSKAGVCSRTEARQVIARGHVRVNGRTVKDPEHWVNPDRDDVLYDGKPLRPERKSYILLYKPKGYLTTYRDPQGRPTVYDLLKSVDHYVFPVGRLDLDTSGLLLLTNDTEFAERVTNPEFHVPKTYLVKTATLLGDSQLESLRQGVALADGPTRPASVRRLRDSASKSFFEITITEGRNRQVRRMVEAAGSKVLKLVRTAIGPVGIGDLAIGHWRQLSADEVRQLRRAARPAGRAPASGRPRPAGGEVGHRDGG